MAGRETGADAADTEEEVQRPPVVDIDGDGHGHDGDGHGGDGHGHDGEALEGRGDGPAPEEDGRGKLGRNYLKLWTASAVSNLGDGIDGVALPLLAEALTRDPLLFAGVAMANRLPWLLFSLHAGAIADRVDRRKLMYVSNAIRFVLMAALGVAILLDAASIWWLYVVALGLGTFEVLFDNAAQSIMPSVVPRDQLEKANGRLFAGEIVTNQFLGPTLGGILFGVAAALPILIDAGTFAISAGLIFAMTGTYTRDQRRARRLSAEAEALAPAEGDLAPTDASVGSPTARPTPPARPRMRTEIREGLTWLWRHRLLRTMAILLAAMNGTTMMGYAILALYVVGEGSILQLSPVWFGVLFTAGAAGSFLASLTAERIVPAIGRGRVLWSTLLAMVLVPLTIGLTSNVWVFATMQVLFGFTAVLWNVITVSLRQRIIPDELLGRVNSVYRFLGWGAMPIGALLGGAIAEAFGLRAPWFAAAAIMLVALVPAIGVISAESLERARQEAES
jgi:MFS family permease